MPINFKFKTMKTVMRFFIALLLIGSVSCKDTKEVEEKTQIVNEEIKKIDTEIDEISEDLDQEVKELEDALNELEN